MTTLKFHIYSRWSHAQQTEYADKYWMFAMLAAQFYVYA